jgi:hypothetical protein
LRYFSRVMSSMLNLLFAGHLAYWRRI